MTKRAYKYEKRMFLYDEEKALVLLVSPITEEMKADNQEWQEKYSKDLWEVVNGYVVYDRIGLARENWKNLKTRKEYLYQWCCELDYEFDTLMSEFKNL